MLAYTLVPVSKHGDLHLCSNYQGLLNVFEYGVAGAELKWGESQKLLGFDNCGFLQDVQEVHACLDLTSSFLVGD